MQWQHSWHELTYDEQQQQLATKLQVDMLVSGGVDLRRLLAGSSAQSGVQQSKV